MQTILEEQPTLHEFGTRLDGMDYLERFGVYAVIENSYREIAVIETSAGYFLPGGGVDSGETEIEALNREIMEEIGYQASVLAEIGEAVEYIKARVERKYYRIHGKFYKVQLDSKLGEGIEADHRLVGLSREDAPKLLVRQSQAWAIQRISKEYERLAWKSP